MHSHTHLVGRHLGFPVFTITHKLEINTFIYISCILELVLFWSKLLNLFMTNIYKITESCQICQNFLYKECVHAQLCPTLCDATDCILTGSSVHGIFQGRVLEWVNISCSRVTFPTQGSNLHHFHLLHRQADSLPLSYLGSPYFL